MLKRYNHLLYSEIGQEAEIIFLADFEPTGLYTQSGVLFYRQVALHDSFVALVTEAELKMGPWKKKPDVVLRSTMDTVGDGGSMVKSVRYINLEPNYGSAIYKRIGELIAETPTASAQEILNVIDTIYEHALSD